MSLLDDFIESSQQEYDPQLRPLPELPPDVPLNGHAAPLASKSKQQAIRSVASTHFHLDQVQFHLPALLTSMVVSNNILIVVLSNHRLLRVDLDDPLDVAEIEWTVRPSDGKLIGLHLDPTGRHLLLCTEHGETYYLFHTWKKTKPLTRLRGMPITAVAWNQQASTSQTSTQEILLGTQQGQLYETWLDPTDEFFKKEERYVHLVYTLPVPDIPPPHAHDHARITGLHVDRIANTANYHVLATTSTRLYQFLGRAAPSNPAAHEAGAAMFAPLFAQYANPNFHELPGAIHASSLALYTAATSSTARTLCLFAWSSAPGIYQGQLDLASEHTTTDDIIENSQLIPYPLSELEDGSMQASPDTPRAMALSAFHVILLYDRRVKVLNYVNQKTVFEETLPLGPGEKMLGLTADTRYHTYWLYTTTAIYELVVQHEDSDVWRLFLAKRDFDRALAHCKDPAHTNQVHIAMADHHFATMDYTMAARLYAKTNVTFEQVVLRFMAKKEKDALRLYLLTKLRQLDSKARTQKCILATWLVEIYLAKINEFKELASSVAYTSTYYDGTMAPKGQTALAFYQEQEQHVKDEFDEFLHEHQAHLHRATVYKLISSHGHTTELIYYATLLNDNDKVISYWIEQREYTKALDVLGKQSNLDLFYKHSPPLMEHVPRETVDIWMLHDDLNPRLLIPSLLRYDHRSWKDRASQHQTIRYLSHVVNKLHNTDPAVHNALLTLYATQATRDETALLSFLKNEGRDMYYNPDYALRLCNQFGRSQSCIYLYSAMGFYEEAVHQALRLGDLDVARTHADKPFDDDDLAKKLWLAIAKYVIQEKHDIKTAMEYVKQSNVLKIEDILPYFPDYILIDDFKDDIYKALEDYNSHIGTLKSDMDDATKNAQLIRVDVRQLKSRSTQVDHLATCCLCSLPLLTRQFYVFPCDHQYHMDCLINKITKFLPMRQLRRLASLQEQLAKDIRLQNKLQYATRKDWSVEDERLTYERISTRIGQLKAELDDIVAEECVYCGDIMIDTIDQPFLSVVDDAHVIHDWAL
ncbi:Pep3/Vps18/deep orange family-domain-containing protein [Gongronella butleri]|nr:Pep3/Vps18/deep orange family-domain-containing protein [Gongronella butleri]